MSKRSLQTILSLIAVIIALWLGLWYIFPILFPFLLGAALAAGAEPLVKLLQKKLRFPRWLASLVCISLGIILLLGLITLLAALALRELRSLSGAVPTLTQTAQTSLAAAEDWLLTLADGAPDALRPGLIQGVRNFFSGGSALLEQLAGWALGLATGILGRIPGGLLGLGTAVLSAYMISGKYPVLRQKLEELLFRRGGKLLSALQGLKEAVFGWVKAQCKLSALTFCVTAVSFLLMGIKGWLLWALLTALVDAVPLLGTGTVLLPWSLVCFVQGNRGRSLGLLLTYLAALLLRTTMEPRLVGRQLGLDPLATLLALYAGYRLFGLMGMILSPLLAVTAVRLTRLREG